MNEPERPDVEGEGGEDHALDRLRQFEHERGFEESEVGPDEPAEDETPPDAPPEEESTNDEPEGESGGEDDEDGEEDQGGMPEP